MIQEDKGVFQSFKKSGEMGEVSKTRRGGPR